jgi:hypothetical protein
MPSSEGALIRSRAPLPLAPPLPSRLISSRGARRGRPPARACPPLRLRCVATLSASRVLSKRVLQRDCDTAFRQRADAGWASRFLGPIVVMWRLRWRILGRTLAGSLCIPARARRCPAQIAGGRVHSACDAARPSCTPLRFAAAHLSPLLPAAQLQMGQPDESWPFAGLRGRHRSGRGSGQTARGAGDPLDVNRPSQSKDAERGARVRSACHNPKLRARDRTAPTSARGRSR